MSGCLKMGIDFPLGTLSQVSFPLILLLYMLWIMHNRLTPAVINTVVRPADFDRKLQCIVKSRV